jgi:hypothetical protein
MLVENLAFAAWMFSSSSIVEGRSTSRLTDISTVRAPHHVSNSGLKMYRRAKGSAMKIISKPNPSHQYMDITSTAVRKAKGTAYESTP